MLKFVIGNKTDLIDVMEQINYNECVSDKMLREFSLSKKAEFMKKI